MDQILAWLMLWYQPESETSAQCCDLHCASPVMLGCPGCYQATDPPCAAFLLEVNSVLPRWGETRISPLSVLLTERATSRESGLVLRHCSVQVLALREKQEFHQQLPHFILWLPWLCLITQGEAAKCSFAARWDTIQFWVDSVYCCRELLNCCAIAGCTILLEDMLRFCLNNN